MLVTAEFPDVFDAARATAAGVSASGNLAPSRCNEWTDGTSGSSGRFGEAFDVDSSWSSGGLLGCDNLHHLYCFQQ